MLVDFQTTQATGTAERDTVPVLVDQAKERGFHPKTLGGDKGYDTGDCVAALRRRGVTPHVAQNTSGRSSAIDGRTTRHPGYAISQRIRKRVEEIFGWMKTVGGFRRTPVTGFFTVLRPTSKIPGTLIWVSRPSLWTGRIGCSWYQMDSKPNSSAFWARKAGSIVYAGRERRSQQPCRYSPRWN